MAVRGSWGARSAWDHFSTTRTPCPCQPSRSRVKSPATDVTGFGLLGHALNVARASRKSIHVWSQAVPVIDAAAAFVAQGVWAQGLQSNLDYLNGETEWGDGVSEATRRLFADPQTSGGLLVTIAPSRMNDFLKRLAKARVRAAVIGEVTTRRGRPLHVLA